MSQYLDDLTKNNNRPCDTAILEIKELLLVPLKQLEETNAEIDRLKDLIRRLEEKRAEIEKSINRYNCVLSPIRRVPQDILHTIFGHCLPTHRNSTMAASEPPMLLSRVCSSWRSTAMATPRLWAQLHIPFRKEIEGRGSQRGEPVIPLEKVTDVLQLRCRGAKEWLSRSGDCSLSISISYHLENSAFSHSFHTIDRMDEASKLLLNTLLPFSSRWRTLELNVPFSVYSELESMLSTHTLLMLAQLRARTLYHPAYMLEAPQTQPPSALFKAPNLRRVSIEISSNITPWWRSPDATQLLTWNNITHLSIYSPCTLQDCFTLLKRYSQLVHLDVSLQVPWDAPENNFSIHEMVYLPYLLSLWIKVVNTSSSLATILYNWVDAPELRWIGYHNSAIARMGDHTPAVDDIPVSFIQRATNLTKLDVDRYYLSPSNILDILQMASQNALTHLSLTSTSIISGSTIMDPFDLETLIIDDMLDRTSTNQVLLPHLQVFELHMTKVVDDIVLRFITSRMDSLSDIAVLRKVKIRFDRLKDQDGLDIAEEVRKRAEMVGIQMDVNLQYSLSSLQVERKYNFLSPSFIFASFNDTSDRTWTFKEWEEYDTQW